MSVVWHGMGNTIISDPILRRFGSALAEAYDSDYDIAVFIHRLDSWLTEVIRLADIGTDVLLETGAVISAKPFRAGTAEANHPLMRAIHREGVEL